jgi:hypothetical protein
MKKAIILSSLLALSLPTSLAIAGTAYQPQQYYNWARVRQQNEMARLRGIQNQQHLCQRLKSSGRNLMWTGC